MVWSQAGSGRAIWASGSMGAGGCSTCMATSGTPHVVAQLPARSRACFDAAEKSTPTSTRVIMAVLLQTSPR